MASSLSLPDDPASTLCKIVSNYYAILHHESNALQFGDIRQRIPADRDNICKLARFDCPNTVLPSQHFCSIDCYGPNHIEGRHPGGAEFHQSVHACFSACFSWIKPAHIGSLRKLHTRLHDALHELLVTRFSAFSTAHLVGMNFSRQDNARLGDLQEKAVIKSRSQIKKDAFLFHLFKLLIRYIVAVLDGICACGNRGLYAGGVSCVDGNFKVLPVRLFDHGSKLSEGDVLAFGHLYHIHILKDILSDGLPRLVRPTYQQELLPENCVGQSRIEV